MLTANKNKRDEFFTWLKPIVLMGMSDFKALKADLEEKVLLELNHLAFISKASPGELAVSPVKSECAELITNLLEVSALHRDGEASIHQHIIRQSGASFLPSDPKFASLPSLKLTASKACKFIHFIAEHGTALQQERIVTHLYAKRLTGLQNNPNITLKIKKPTLLVASQAPEKFSIYHPLRHQRFQQAKRMNEQLLVEDYFSYQSSRIISKEIQSNNFNLATMSARLNFINQKLIASFSRFDAMNKRLSKQRVGGFVGRWFFKTNNDFLASYQLRFWKRQVRVLVESQVLFKTLLKNINKQVKASNPEDISTQCIDDFKSAAKTFIALMSTQIAALSLEPRTSFCDNAIDALKKRGELLNRTCNKAVEKLEQGQVYHCSMRPAKHNKKARSITRGPIELLEQGGFFSRRQVNTPAMRIQKRGAAVEGYMGLVPSRVNCS